MTKPLTLSLSCPSSQWRHPTSSSSIAPSLLPSIFPNIRVFSNELALHIKWPKYWSFGLSISPHKEYLGLISFRIDWFDLLAVQGTLKSLLQHHSSSINSSALSLLYGATLTSIHDDWKNHSFDQTFTGKVTTLLFNMLSRFVIALISINKVVFYHW